MEWIIINFFKYHGIDIYRSLAIAGLIFARLLGTIFQTPFLGGRLVPPQIKVGTSIILLFVFYPMVADNIQGELPTGALPLFFLWLKELWVGFTIGFVASLIFFAVQSCGRFIDLQRGSTMANIMDPYLATQASPLGEFLFQVMIVVILAINGHHFFFYAFARGFQIIPINSFPVIPPGITPLVELILKLSGNIFLISLTLAAPALVTLFLIDVGLGIVNRVAPQIQVFFLGMPIKAMMGVLMLLLAFALMLRQMERYLDLMLQDVYQGIKFLGG
ncbi:MAG: flagellar biosynthetic protein FliR [bacterium]